MKIFDFNLNQLDAVGYSFNKLEISIKLIMDLDAKSLEMTETDFEM